jgi:dCTP diphosphatase
VNAFLQSPEALQTVSHELADVLIYALLLCHEVGVDPVEAIREKLRVNEQRYPVADSKGKADKYDRLNSA